MCGRFSLITHEKALLERFKASRSEMRIEPIYNVSPNMIIPVVVQDEIGERIILPMRWGIVPHWSQEPKTKYRTINAKAESILKSRIFKRPFINSRCLIPATGFYEWQGERGSKVPFHIWLGPDRLFAFAGIFEVWKSKDDTRSLRTTAIITTSPNSIMAPIHDRMPVILEEKDEGLWLDPESHTDDLLALLRPYPDREMRIYQVSAFVNKPSNQGPECIAPI